jgi:peptide/nickel transport system substrate-binding protein
MRSRLLVAGAATLLLAATAAACTKNTGTEDVGAKAAVINGAISTDPADSKGPAAPIKGAKRGGTLYSMQEQDFEHLDPQKTYVSGDGAVRELIDRTLTMFRMDPRTGKELLVGDLATNTGVDVNGDAKTWRYTLKSGLKYQDGTTVTAADVAYGVARSFSPDISTGPHYIQQWLAGSTDYNKDYQGPYHGGADVPPGVTVKGNTITFHLKQAAPDFPYAASFGTTSPLPKSRDTNPAALDSHPFSSGPYKVASYVRDNQLVLVRNKYWKANTDPVRHNYYDRFVALIGPSLTEQTNRLMADNGNDQYAVGYLVPPALVGRVLSDKDLRSRTLSGYQIFVTYLYMNTQRIRDVSVRRAINYAFDKSAYLKAFGGSALGQVASTILSPTVAGYQKYDAYPTKGDHGDVAKAKKLLHGRTPTLVYAYANNAENEKYATIVQSSLERAGFKLVLRPIDASKYYTIIGTRGNPYDIYIGGWGADWPSGSTVIGPEFDGSAIQPTGNNGPSYLNEPDINRRIHQIELEPAAKAARDWAALDKEIMTKYAPVVPMYYARALELTGSKVHDVALSPGLGATIWYNAWVG